MAEFRDLIRRSGIRNGKVFVVTFAALLLAMLVAACECDDEAVLDDNMRFTDSRDGKTYRAVRIGEQIWMAENLDYEYRVGRILTSTYGNWCFENSADSCAKYGRLYTWAAAMDSAVTGCGHGYDYRTTCLISGRVRGVCPKGWHLPDVEEWRKLLSTVDARVVIGNPFENTAGNKLKSAEGWRGESNDDTYGFSALPFSDHYGIYDFFSYTYFWSSSEGYQLSAYALGLGRNLKFAAFERISKDAGCPVRCLKD